MIETYNGKKVIAIEIMDASYAADGKCHVCVFKNENIGTCLNINCTSWERDDMKSVYFISAPKISKERITELELKNGFKLKPQPDGVNALNPYDFEEWLLKIFYYRIKNRV